MRICIFEVLCVGNLHNPDVHYSFNVPMEERSDLFKWDPYGPWQDCSKMCQGTWVLNKSYKNLCMFLSFGDNFCLAFTVWDWNCLLPLSFQYAIYMYTYIYYVCIYVYRYTFICIHIYVFRYICIHIYTCTHMCVYTHTDTFVKLSFMSSLPIFLHYSFFMFLIFNNFCLSLPFPAVSFMFLSL